MQYNVQGNLTIDIEEFEEAIKEAQEQLKKFKESFEELHKIKSSNQMETLVETVQKIREEIKGAKRESDSFNDSLQKEFSKTKKEAKGVATEVNTLDDSFEKTSQSAKKLSENMSSLDNAKFKQINKEMDLYNSKIEKANKELMEQISITDELGAKVMELEAKLEKSPKSRWAGKWKEDLDIARNEYEDSMEDETYLKNSMEKYKKKIQELENELKKLQEVSESSSQQMIEDFNQSAESTGKMENNLKKLKADRIDSIKTSMKHYSEEIKKAEKNLESQRKTTQKFEAEITKLNEKLVTNSKNRWVGKWETELKTATQNLRKSQEYEGRIKETIESFKLMVNVFEEELKRLENTSEIVSDEITNNFKKSFQSFEQFKASGLYNTEFGKVEMKQSYVGKSPYIEMVGEKSGIERRIREIQKELSVLKGELDTPIKAKMFENLVSELDYFTNRLNELDKTLLKESNISQKLYKPFQVLQKTIENSVNKVDLELGRLRNEYKQTIKEMNNVKGYMEGTQNSLREGYHPFGKSTEEMEKEIVKYGEQYEKLEKKASSLLDKINAKAKESLKLNKDLLKAQRGYWDMSDTLSSKFPSEVAKKGTQEVREELNKTSSASKKFATEMEHTGKSIDEAFSYVDKSVVTRMNTIRRVLPEMEERLKRLRQYVKDNASKYSDYVNRIKKYDKNADLGSLNIAERDVRYYQDKLESGINSYKKLKKEIMDLKSEFNSISPANDSVEGIVTNLKHLEHQLSLSGKRLKEYAKMVQLYKKEMYAQRDKGEYGYHEEFRMESYQYEFEKEMKYFRELQGEIKQLKTSLKEDFGIIFEDVAKSFDSSVLTGKIDVSAEALNKSLNNLRRNIRKNREEFIKELEKLNSIRREIRLQEDLMELDQSRVDRGYIKGNELRNLERTIESRKTVISALKGEIESLPKFLQGFTSKELAEINELGNYKKVSQNIREINKEFNQLNATYESMFADTHNVKILSAQLDHLKNESSILRTEIKKGVESLRLMKNYPSLGMEKRYKIEERSVRNLVNDYNKLQTKLREVEKAFLDQFTNVVKYNGNLKKLERKLIDIQKWNTIAWQGEQLESYYSMVQAITGATREQIKLLEKKEMIEQELYSSEGKYFSTTSPYSRQTSMWINEQITDFNNLWRSHSKYYRGIKKEQSEAVQYIKEMNLSIKEQQMILKEGMGVGFAGSGKFNEGMLYGEKFLKNVERIKSTFSSMKSFNFNKALGINEINDAKLKDAINFFNSLQEKTRLLREETSRDFLGTKQFAEAIEYSNKYVESMMKVKSATESIASSASSRRNMFFNESELNRTVGSYQRFRNEQQLLNRSTISLSSGFGKLGEYSKSASSQVSTLGGVLRSLRTTMSMIGGMFVWEFAFKIVDATQSTIKAKSEMESYYKSLNMGSKEIGQFNSMLDKTIGKFQKMNKFQLGETITALGVEFKLNTEEMNQIAKVAPMIVNEYLRAGRSTEEAILAIKDISQGEFLRLSRETGVGAKEIKEAGWNGDNKDIVSLYKALEKIGKARHWDTFASKATSLNDVLLITENRMTEFATLISDWVTPLIVMGFNAMGDAFTKIRLGYEGLDPTTKSLTTALGGLGFSLGTIATLHYKVVPAIEAFTTSMLSNVLGIDKEIAKTYGLSTAIGHQVAVEKVATAQKNLGSSALDIRINKLKAEEMANKLGLETTELRTEYEKLQSFALKESSISMNEKLFAQKALLLAEEQGITVEEAKNALLVEEKIAHMGTLKAMLAYKLGLDMTIVSNNGLKDAILVKIGFMEADALATEGATASTLTFIATMGILLLPIALVVASIALLTAKFLELQSSMETVTKTLDESPDKISELNNKITEQKKTIENLKKSYDEGKASATELSMANEQLVNYQNQLEHEQKKYDQALQISHRFQKNTADMEAQRATNIKEINKELRENHRITKEIEADSDMAKMGSAWAESYKLQQINTYMETHRKERNDQLIRNLENANKNDEEIVQFANDWNQAYTDREIALEKMADPSSDTWTRLGAYWDNWWASAKLSWIEFWSDPFKGFGEDIALPSIDFALDLFNLGDSQSHYDFLKGIDEDITNWLNDFNKITIDDLFDFTGITGFSNWLNDLSVGGNFGQGFNDALTSMSSAWDSFAQPIVDFFNNLSVPSDWNPFKGWNFDIDSFIRDNLISDGSGGVASKSIDLSSLLKIDFSGFKSMFENGFRNSFGNIPSILTGAGQIWKGLSTNNGKMVIDGMKSVLNNLPQVVKNPLQAGARVISNMGHTWGTNAFNTAKRIYDGIKNGIGDIAGIVKGKLDAVTTKIKNIKKDWGSAVDSAIKSITNPFEGLSIPFFSGAYGAYGFKGTVRRQRSPNVSGTSNIRLSRPVYGMSNGSFESVLTGLLTSQGFRSPSSYEYYPNNRKTTQETWDSGKSNCFDGAMLIASLGSMFGLKSRLIFGTYNGQGHTGAMVGGKLYDMTQFQKRGVFRGTRGVHFGSSGKRNSDKYGSSSYNKKEININVTNDLSNATIYGIDDLDKHIEEATEKTFYKLNSPDMARGY